MSSHHLYRIMAALLPLLLPNQRGIDVARVHVSHMLEDLVELPADFQVFLDQKGLPYSTHLLAQVVAPTSAPVAAAASCRLSLIRGPSSLTWHIDRFTVP